MQNSDVENLDFFVEENHPFFVQENSKKEPLESRLKDFVSTEIEETLDQVRNLISARIDEVAEFGGRYFEGELSRDAIYGVFKKEFERVYKAKT